jgi:hypothetical protein
MFRLTPSSDQDKIRFHYLLVLCEFQIIKLIINNLELTQYFSK